MVEKARTVLRVRSLRVRLKIVMGYRWFKKLKALLPSTLVDTTLKSMPLAMLHCLRTEFHPAFVSENRVCYNVVSFFYTT